MKKFILLALSFALATVLMTGCAAAPVTLIPLHTPSPIPPTSKPESNSTKQTDQPAIPILVPPFYYSNGIQIYVGNYSEQLATSNLQELVALADEMSQKKQELTPEQMFVLAIRLYDLGDKDDSVYWFYEAQFRSKLFLKSLDSAHIGSQGDLAYELITEYGSFTKSAGEFINGYAGCDVDNWVKIATTVKDDNPKPPALDKLFPDAVFVERGQWQGINDQVAAGLGVLIDQLSQQKESIKQQRAEKNQDARFCK
jgi:hypothetical protein